MLCIGYNTVVQTTASNSGKQTYVFEMYYILLTLMDVLICARVILCVKIWIKIFSPIIKYSVTVKQLNINLQYIYFESVGLFKKKLDFQMFGLMSEIMSVNDYNQWNKTSV